MKRALLLVLALGLAGPAAADDITERAGRLADLRAEVETLSQDLERAEAEQRSQQRALAQGRAELDAQIRREELRLAQIASKLAEQRDALAAQGTDEVLAAAVRASAAELKARIGAGLPFRVQERAAEVDRLVEQLDSGLLRPERAVARLWALVEDELRLAREVGLQRQPIALEDGERLVEVAHVGLVAAYFRTEDGELGVAKRDGPTWTWTVLDDTGERALLTSLFDDLRKGVREGWFELPGQLPQGGV